MVEEPDDYTGYVLWQAHHRLARALDARLTELRLNLPQLGALVHLAARPGLSAASLARLLPLTPQAVSTMVGRLEAAGYLTRSTPESGRNQPLTLTTTGLAALDDASRLVTTEEDRFFAPLTGAERSQLHQLLARCVQRADAAGEQNHRQRDVGRASRSSP